MHINKETDDMIHMLTFAGLFLLTLLMLAGNGQKDARSQPQVSQSNLIQNSESHSVSAKLPDVFFSVVHNNALESESFLYIGITNPQHLLSDLCYLIIFTLLFIFHNSIYEIYLKKSGLMSGLNLERIMTLLQKVDGKKENPPSLPTKVPMICIGWA